MTDINALQETWLDFQSQVIEDESPSPEMITLLLNHLKEITAFGKNVSTPVERDELQSLAREVADCVFSITSEYPVASIEAPIEKVARVSNKEIRFDISHLTITENKIEGRDRYLKELDKAWNDREKCDFLSIVCLRGDGQDFFSQSLVA